MNSGCDDYVAFGYFLEGMVLGDGQELNIVAR